MRKVPVGVWIAAAILAALIAVALFGYLSGYWDLDPINNGGGKP
jgi:hypothetical protein